MFELTQADVFRLVEMFTSSDATFMQVRVDDVEVVLSRNEQDGVRPEPTTGLPKSAPLEPAEGDRGAIPVAVVSPASSVTPMPLSSAAVEEEGLVTVDASSLGTFYRAPRPDLPPYVEVGSTVEADATVGLIEAMKVFTGVTAGVRGTVVEVLVEDTQFVEYGQPLFRVRPLEAESGAGS